MGAREQIALVASWAKPLREHVPGSPYQVGQVVVVTGADFSVNKPEEVVGQTGKVTYLEYSCGCGQSFPEWPMIGVLFAFGREEEFWPDELRLSVELAS